MARAIARGATSNCQNPILDLWTLVGGAVADVYSVEFQIFDLSTGSPVQVFPSTPGARQAVDVSTTCPTPGAGKIQTGRYVATWTVGGSEPLGLHRIAWFVRPTSTSAEFSYQTDFDVLAAGLSLRGPAYVLLSELRAEGFSATTLGDARALTLITTASKMVERYTRRFFEPRWRVITLDGAAGPSQFLRDPIIALATGRIDGELVEATSYKVFNRHITEGLTQPDDRDNPKVEFQRITRTLQRIDVYDRPYSNRATWWPGPRNVELVGLFGYTDPDELVQTGVTPELIKRATMMIVARERVGIGASGRAESQSAGNVTSERTRDQSITYGASRYDLIAKGGTGEFTGDPAIDDILAQYMAPPFVGAV